MILWSQYGTLSSNRKYRILRIVSSQACEEEILIISIKKTKVLCPGELEEDTTVYRHGWFSTKRWSRPSTTSAQPSLTALEKLTKMSRQEDDCQSKGLHTCSQRSEDAAVWQRVLDKNESSKSGQDKVTNVRTKMDDIQTLTQSRLTRSDDG